MPASIEDDLSRSTISLVLDAFFRFTLVVAKKAGSRVVEFGGTNDELLGGNGKEGYEPPNTPVDAGADVGDENEAGLELDERAESKLVTRRGLGDNDLALAVSVNCELAASGDSALSRFLSPMHPAVGLDPGFLSDGEREREDEEDEQGEMGVTGSQNPCESFRSAEPGLVGGGEQRLNVNAGLSLEAEQVMGSKSPPLSCDLVPSSPWPRGVIFFADGSDEELAGATLAGIICPGVS